MGSSKKIRQWTSDLKEMGGITREVADKQLEAFNAKMTILKNTVVLAAVAVGESLAPTIEDLGVKIKAVTGEVTKWIEKHPELTEIISKSALGIGALLLVLGPLAMMLPGLVLGFKLLLPVVSALASPVTLLAAAIAGIAISVQKLAENLTTAKKAMSDFREETLIFKNAAENFKKLWIVVRKEGGETLEQFDELFKRFGGNWDMILRTIIKDPKFATLKTLLFEVVTGLKKISLEGKDLSIELPAALQKIDKTVVATKKVFTSWATSIGKAFHDTSVRVAQMKESFKGTSFVVGGLVGDLETGFGKISTAAVKAAKLPPFAVNIPKMSLEDFKEWYKQWLKDLQKEWVVAWQNMMDFSRYFVEQFSAIFNQFSMGQMQRIDNEYEARRTSIENSITDEEAKATAIEKLEKDTDEKRRKAMRTQAIFGKAISLASAVINIAEAITKALTLGPFLGVAAATWVKILGGIQIAAIVATPIPSLAKGGAIEEAAIVGERGPELFVPATPGTIIPLREPLGMATASPGPSYTTINLRIYAQRLDDATIDHAAEKIYRAVKRQERRY